MEVRWAERGGGKDRDGRNVVVEETVKERGGE